MASRRPSLKDIAEKVGCSVSAASIVLNNSKGNIGVGKAMTDAIMRAAEQLGYRVNYHAKALQTGRSLTVGLVYPSDPARENYFGEGLTRGIEHRTHQLGYDLLIFGHDNLQKALDSLSEKRVDGLILSVPGQAIASEHKKSRPIVLINQKAANGYPSVQLDPAPGIRQAVSHLGELGHKKVLFIGMKQNGKQRIPERRKVFLKALEKSGMQSEIFFLDRPKEFSLNIEFQLAWYKKALEQTLTYTDDVSAIFCYNDLVGLALYAVLAERGIKIPGEMSVIGFDNLFANLAIPSLTTISHMLPEIGARAVDLLMDVIGNDQDDPHEVGVRVPSELIIHGSTGVKTGKPVVKD